MPANSSTPSFTCSKCNKQRDASLRSKNRSYCLVCDSHRYNQRTATPRNYEENERLFFERRDREARGVKVCPVCYAEKALGDFDKSGRCKPCRRNEKVQQKYAYRERLAIKLGKKYEPKHDARGIIAQEIKGIGLPSSKRNRRVAIDGQCSWYKGLAPASAMNGQAVLSAMEALRYWINERATDEQVARWYSAKGRPWRNPRLSLGESWRIRYALDIDFNIRERMRRQMTKSAKRDGVAELIRGAFRRGGNSPAAERMLGYSMSELRTHLEAQFTDGMSWDAFMRGEIHIDHIIPQAFFDMSDDVQWRECWSLANLRPMWGPDNIAKGDRLPCGTLGRHAKRIKVTKCD